MYKPSIFWPDILVASFGIFSALENRKKNTKKTRFWEKSGFLSMLCFFFWGVFVPQCNVARLRGSCGKSQRPGVQSRCSPGAWHFSCRFPDKMALVKCPCTFRLRKRTQNVLRGIWARHFSCKFSTQNGSFQLGVWHLSCRFPDKMALVTCL